MVESAGDADRSEADDRALNGTWLELTWAWCEAGRAKLLDCSCSKENSRSEGRVEPFSVVSKPLRLRPGAGALGESGGDDTDTGDVAELRRENEGTAGGREG